MKRILCALLLGAAVLSAVEFQPAPELDFADRTDFQLVTRGLLRKNASDVITDAEGKTIWNFRAFDFLGKIDPKDPKTVHPSLLRQAILNNHAGLYEVVPGIYQVRGFDLANTTFVRSKSGWIVLDTLTVPATATAAKALVDAQFGSLPVVALIYSHSHADHFGGAKGMISETDAASGKVKVIAPMHFLEKAVSENIMAGNAMTRRSIYSYGIGLPDSPEGHVDAGLGKRVASGPTSLIAPNRTIEKPIEEMEVDGVKIIFQLTPGTEAPAEMNAYFPDFKALWIAENSACTLHNIYTLRGAEVRDAKMWGKYLHEALCRFGGSMEAMFASHNWPAWGDEARERLRNQRDIYAYIHNHSLYLANRGVTINEIHNEFTAPASLTKHWYNRGYYGSLSHDSRAVVNKYLGFFDMVPASLNKLSPAEAGKRYVEYMGGAASLLERARKDFARGDYRWVAEAVNHLVFADPANREAKALLADCYEQLGFACENATWRDIYLVGARELRTGILPSIPGTVNPDTIAAMEPEMMLDGLGIAVNPQKAEGKALVIHFRTPEAGYLAELRNAVLNVLKDFQSPDAGLTVEAVSKDALLELLLKPTRLDELVKAKKIELKGDAKLFQELFGVLDLNIQQNFPIVTP